MEKYNNLQITLVEPGVKYFIGNSLKQCRDFKNKYYNIFFNIAILFILIISISLFLIYKYKGKFSPIDIEIKNRKKQEYIINKLQNINQIKQKMHQKIITNLPNWEQQPELEILQKKYY